LKPNSPNFALLLPARVKAKVSVWLTESDVMVTLAYGAVTVLLRRMSELPMFNSILALAPGVSHRNNNSAKSRMIFRINHLLPVKKESAQG
jgi:hypothetical protein